MNQPKNTTNPDADRLASLLRDCLAEIAIHDQDLRVEAVEVASGLVDVMIRANPGDIKRIIGTGGAHFRAIRSYCKVWGRSNRLEVEVANFNQPKDSRERYGEFKPARFWPKEKIVSILERMVEEIIVPAPARIVEIDAQYSHLIFQSTIGSPGLDELADALRVLGNAMGKKNGHTLSVHFRKIGLA